MSCVAIGQAPGVIIFAADGISYYGDTGNVAGFVSKMMVLSHIQAVIAWTGIGGFGHVLYERLALQYLEFDEMIERLSATAEECWVHIITNGYPWSPKVQVTIGGWSESRERFEVYKLSSYGKLSPNAEGTQEPAQPWKVYPILSDPSPVWASTAPDPETFEPFGLDWEGENSLLDMTARLICANRASSGMVTDPDTGHTYPFAVGGFLQFAVILPGRIVTWIGHRWPDEIGKPVDPSAGDPMPAFPILIP